MYTSNLRFRDILLPGISVPTFDPQVIDHERASFRHVFAFFDDVEEGNEYPEQVMADAIVDLGRTIPQVKWAYTKLYNIRNRYSQDLGKTIPNFVSYPVPALLIKWRQEVKTLENSKLITGGRPTAVSTPLPTVAEATNDKTQGGAGAASSAIPSRRTAAQTLDQHLTSAPSKSRKTKSESTKSDRSDSTTGVREPDFFLCLDRQEKRVLILIAGELKTADEAKLHWKKGMTQEVLYLHQCSMFCGTRLGFFVFGTKFCRLFAQDKLIVVETTSAGVMQAAKRFKLRPGPDDNSASNRMQITITVQQLFALYDVLADEMPHDLVSTSLEPSPDAIKLFCDHMALPLVLLKDELVDQVGDRLPPQQSFSFDSLLTVELGGQQQPDEPLPLEELLELAYLAHPNTYPRWWVEAKKTLFKQGSPDALVPRSAKPKRGGGSKDGKDDGGLPGDDPGDDPRDGGAGGDRGDGGGRSDGWKAPADGGKGKDAAAGGLQDGSVEFKGVQGVAMSVTPPPDPLHDDDGAGHLQRWLHQQAPMTQSPEKARALYQHREIGRTSAIALSTQSEEDDEVSSEAMRERDELVRLQRDMARFTLAGFRVSLVTPQTMSMA